MNWTDDQLNAIEHDGKNILVAAAAGSGKTAVLVQRIIEKIVHKGVSISQILALTFTEAAAKEMKRKISDALSRELALAVAEKNKKKISHLREQSLLAPSANISTIHAFCIEVIKNNIHLTQLPTDFSIIDETENKVLKKQALEEVLELYYARIDKREGFKNLVLGYSDSKGDSELKTLILNLYDFSKSLPFPEKWLNLAVREYKMVEKSNSMDGTLWQETIVVEYFNALEVLKENVDTQLNDVNILEEINPKNSLIAKFRNFAKEIELLKESRHDDFSEIYRKFKTLKLPTMAGGARKPDLNEQMCKTRIGNINRLNKKILVRLNEEIFGDKPSVEVERIRKTYPAIKALATIVKLLGARHTFLKYDRSRLDFSDLEHEFLKLVVDRKGRRTEIAKRLSEKYVEILVDEYQDTNKIQDTMFNAISGKKGNIFMVGDLKQSIYGFRNALPRLFSEKYETYTKDGVSGDGERIQLFKNFRSRNEVINTTNCVFSQIMSKKVGDLDYNENEYLVKGAEYPKFNDMTGYATEFLITDVNKANYSDEGDYFNMDSSEMEAITIAKRIRNLVDNKEISITDRDTGKTRDIKYGDIVILMRGQKKSAPIFETALENENIPVYTQVGHSYLGSIEVMTVLSFLQIIDNPYQDIPLIAVMRSPLFGFTADELAVIRVASPKSNFFDALNVAEDVKSLEFCSTLNELRNQSEYMGIDEIVWKICTEFHYFALVGAMVGGEIRQANLKLLFERAVEYEQTSLDGLFGFMNYIETIKSEDKDLSAVKAFSDGDDVVRIMTIHASKGLEFPVVILADTAKRFNSQDMNKKILWHTDMGISMDYVDVQKRVRYPSVATSLMKERKTIQSKSEEMRLLYVAFTRAKEKLIISTTSNIKVNKWANTIFNNEKIVPENVDEYTCYADLIAISLLRHKNANQIRKMAEMACDTEKDYGFELKVLSVNHESRPIKTTERIKEKIEKETKNVEESSCLEEIKERLNYKYPHAELGRVPLKMSVTELKRRQAMDDGHVARLKCINDNSFKKTSEVTGAEIGTITHYVLQHMDFKKTETLEEVNEQVENMMLEGLINKTQFGVVNKNGIYGFFKSDIGMRLKKSINYKREFDFYMKINPCEIYPEIKCDEEDSDILVQGIADCIFEEDEHWVLLDYKTDKISPDKVQKKAEYYKEQIDLYTQGLNAILEHKKIEERYLYFLDCDMAIKL